ncbi:bifunctional diguanylate cyclase/phosphodiesterase [uncultured Cellulomonas sp.]|uniref:putative bifunctional diguanylate cyclase/phosphodiesterase n=1 Tax=uncultured Cellulomonas sp. TaxID=189682 RepID=UPI00260F1C5B|nr:GGDEF domain-containing protein [uncultured Cellulomonas sp.]
MTAGSSPDGPDGPDGPDEPDPGRLWWVAPSANLTLDTQGRVVAANATLCAWTGRTPADLAGTAFGSLLAPGDRVLWASRWLPELLATGRVAEASVQVTGPDRGRRAALLSAVRIAADGEDAQTHVALVEARQRQRHEDALVAARRAAEESEARVRSAQAALEALVHRDALTGLHNRAGLLDALHRRLACAPATAGDAPVPTVLSVDLDGFRTVNDDLGHASGDELLREVGTRLAAACPAGAVVARFAGDEFVVVDEVAPSRAARVAAHLLRAVTAPFVLSGVEVVIDAGVGIAHAAGPVRAEDVEHAAQQLLRRADLAMDQAKARGTGQWVVHDAGSPDPVADRMALLEQLRAAVRDGDLRVHYQPRVDLVSGSVRGVEALVRWQHRTRGLLQPGDFIDAAEQSGIIRDLGAWVLGEAVSQALRWQTTGGPPDLQVAVNVSARQLADVDLAERVAGVLQSTGLAASHLVLEITETALMRRPDVAVGTLRRLKELGVLIAIDDFGTGYSSLTYLKQFPVDELKIDRSFVSGLTTDPADRAIVETCVQMAHTLGLVAVAEGVETDGQRDALRELGCDQAQGYGLGRPVPADVLGRRLLATAGPGPATGPQT